MRLSSRTYEVTRDEAEVSGRDAADGYIDQLVQQMVDAAGVKGTKPAGDQDEGVDVVQAELEKLRNAASEQPGSGVNSPPLSPLGDPDTASAVMVNRAPEVYVIEPEAVTQRSTVGANVADRHSQSVSAASSRRKPNGAEEVILQAMAVTSPAGLSVGGESVTAPTVNEGPKVKSRSVFLTLLLAVLLLLMGGLAVVLGQYALSLTEKNLLESYWIEQNIGRPNESDSGKFQVAGGEPSATYESSSLSVAPKTSASQAIPDGVEGIQQLRAPTFVRRTVKTFRVGADGRIIFGPRAGS